MAKRLLYVTFEPLGTGGASRTHVVETVRALRRIGWNVELSHAVPADEVGHGQTSGRLRMRLARWARATRAIWGRKSDQVLYVRWHPLATIGLLGAWARVRGGIAIEVNGPLSEVSAAHPPLRLFMAFARLSFRASLACCDLVVATSESTAEYVRAWRPPRNCHALPNGVDARHFSPEGRRMNIGSQYVAFIGVLARWQGIETMITAAQHPEWPQHVQLVIGGDGPERGRVEDAVSQGLPVAYFGTVRHEEVPSIYRGALAGLSVKNYKAAYGSPLKVYEVMATGRPCIITDLPGQVAAFMGEPCGLVVAPESPIAVARAVAALSADKCGADTMGRVARNVAVQHHDWRSRIETLSGWLEELPGRSGTS